MDDKSLDYITDDLIDMFNSKSEKEWNDRWECLVAILVNSAEIAPIDSNGYLQKKPGRIYIRPYIYTYDDSRNGIHIGRDNNAYIMNWNRMAGKVILVQSKYISYRNYNMNTNEYKRFPLYILPNNLKKSYRQLIKNV